MEAERKDDLTSFLTSSPLYLKFPNLTVKDYSLNGSLLIPFHLAQVAYIELIIYGHLCMDDTAFLFPPYSLARGLGGSIASHPTSAYLPQGRSHEPRSPEGHWSAPFIA